MSKRLKLLVAIIIGSIAAACCAVGCSIGQPGREEVLATYQGGHVTYYANGGNFNKNKAIVVRDMYFKDADVPFFDMPDLEGEIFVSRGSYDFMGWYLPAIYPEGDEHAGEIMYTYTYEVSPKNYKTVPAYAKLNEDGSPAINKTDSRPLFYIDGSDETILEEDIVVVADTTKPINSERTIGADEHLIVCANWKPSLRFEYRLAVEEDGDYVYDKVTYHKNDVIMTSPFGRKETNNPGQTATISFKGMTFVGNYKDANCTNLAKDDYKRADCEGTDVITIWAKFIKGDWTIVKDTDGVKEMFSSLYDENRSFYLVDDIALSDNTTLNTVTNCYATIDGNGHTISNLKFSSSSISSGANIAPVFGIIYKSAKIKNLTLSGINIDITCKGSMTFHAICKAIETGATLENLTIENIKAKISLPGSVINAQDGNRNAWIFGSNRGTDAAFLAAFSGVTLSGTNVLEIN